MSAAATKAKLTALVDLGRELLRQNYAWTCPSAETQALVNGRFANRRAFNLTDLFGWNREGCLRMLSDQLPQQLIDSLRDVGVLKVTDGETVRSLVRFSNYADLLFAHSAWPPNESDAVAVGPETQRFGAFITRELQIARITPTASTRPFTVVDIGCGSGAAGILVARWLASNGGPPMIRVLLTDRNPRALLFAEVNARLANLAHYDCRSSDVLADVSEPPMLILAHTQGLIDPQRRAYLRGGGELGTGMALRILDESMDRLLPGGTLLMCTVAPVVRGVDLLWRNLAPKIARATPSRRVEVHYQVLEADAFSPYLSHPAYAEADRLTLVGLTVHLRSGSR